MKLTDNIHQNIKILRIENGWTQDELAQRLGSNKQNVMRYEKGIVANIPYEIVVKAAEVFGVSPSTLMGWEDKYENNFSRLQAKMVALIRDDKDLQSALSVYFTLKSEQKKAICDLIKTMK